MSKKKDKLSHIGELILDHFFQAALLAKFSGWDKEMFENTALIAWDHANSRKDSPE